MSISKTDIGGKERISYLVSLCSSNLIFPAHENSNLYIPASEGDLDTSAYLIYHRHHLVKMLIEATLLLIRPSFGKDATKMEWAYKDQPPVLFCNAVYIRESMTSYINLGRQMTSQAKSGRSKSCKGGAAGQQEKGVLGLLSSHKRLVKWVIHC